MRHLRTLPLPLLALACLALAAWRGGYWTSPPPPTVAVDSAELYVHDGDTFLLAGRQLRLLGVDTPERGAPWFDGDQEPWASRAADLVQRELRSGDVSVLSHGRRDVYGRELVHVVVDDRPLAVTLVRAGLAYPTVARYGDQGYPRIAERILREAVPPAFEIPWRWRKAHRLDR